MKFRGKVELVKYAKMQVGNGNYVSDSETILMVTNPLISAGFSENAK